MMLNRFAFFLGGQDLEMVTIAALLEQRLKAGDQRIAAIHDNKLAWGAKASDYRAQIAAAVGAGQTPVLVELQRDIPLPHGAIDIDHHGNRAGEPCALRQVFDVLGLDESAWSHYFQLVAANDTGHVEALRRMGAGDDEIATIRDADRAAQGVSRAQEAAGQAALAKIETAFDNTLLIARLPHNRSATVADPLAIAGDNRDLLIFSPDMTQFFGAGSRIVRLDAAFEGGWRGGELPVRGFWGVARAIDEAAVMAVLAG